MSGAAGTTTVDFGATPVDYASFTVTDPGIGATDYVEAFFMMDSTVDNTVEDHERAAVFCRLTCLPAAGSFTLKIYSLMGLMSGHFKVRYAYST
jgi:hypothetical protein